MSCSFGKEVYHPTCMWNGACSIGKFIFTQGFSEEESWLEVNNAWW